MVVFIFRILEILLGPAESCDWLHFRNKFQFIDRHMRAIIFFAKGFSHHHDLIEVGFEISKSLGDIDFDDLVSRRQRLDIEELFTIL